MHANKLDNITCMCKMKEVAGELHSMVNRAYAALCQGGMAHGRGHGHSKLSRRVTCYLPGVAKAKETKAVAFTGPQPYRVCSEDVSHRECGGRNE